MRPAIASILAVGYTLIYSALAQVPIPLDSALVGTWTTKSGQVLTGSGFYDPTTDTLIEPSLTGISYSFTEDGFYEEAFYRAISNPVSPQCPSGIMQWQHGSVIQYNNGTLILTPIAIDGRELQSEPCLYDHSILSKYDQPELFQSYEVLADTYNGKQRLNLYMWDGTPMNPMWLAYPTPVMLPTTTLYVTHTESPTGSSKFRRREENAGSSAEDNAKRRERLKRMAEEAPVTSLAGKWFWIGLGSTALGGALVFWF